jgi:hypothetical protein
MDMSIAPDIEQGCATESIDWIEFDLKVLNQPFPDWCVALDVTDVQLSKPIEIDRGKVYILLG